MGSVQASLRCHQYQKVVRNFKPQNEKEGEQNSKLQKRGKEQECTKEKESEQTESKQKESSLTSPLSSDTPAHWGLFMGS